jgi:hypothetical protein
MSIQQTGQTLADSGAPDPLIAVQRADVEAAVAAHRRDANGAVVWVAAIGGLGGTFALWIIGLRSSSEQVLAATFIGGWALLIGANLVMAGRYRAQISRYGLRCPACSKPLIQYVEPRSGKKRIDGVLTSGRCPDCGARIFEPEG